MTTLDPGASVVLTQGLRVRPFSTALRASSAAPIMTCGFEVFVQDVIAAIATAPWSIVKEVPSARVTSVGFDGRPARSPEIPLEDAGASPGLSPIAAGASEAGNDSSSASSAPPAASSTTLA